MKIISFLALAIALVGCSVSKHTGHTNDRDNLPVVAPATSLVFPVAGSRSSIGSFWGDARDGGKRKHEGVDIFAKKGTEVVAVCDGVIVSVGNDGIGGKTIWLQSDDYAWDAYYAHLDNQYVYEGQTVSKGDVIGSVGNTGNAKLTASHLHFGIYTRSGAIDPLPFVKTAPKVVSTVVVAEEPSKKPVKKATAKTKTSSSKKATT